MIAVFGSVNMDLVVRTPRWPQGGETISGHSFTTTGGGKGANQAIGCARLGAATSMVGRVGADDFGRALLSGLAAEGVDSGAVYSDPDAATGVAAIIVEDSGENRIILTAGANGAIGAADLQRLEGVLDRSSILLLQLEIPLDAVLAAARSAAQRGITVILDPAPAQALPAELYPLASILTPNETEAAALVGFPLDTPEAVQRAAQTLRERGTKCVIIKLGGRGVYWDDDGVTGSSAALKVATVDTVGAGDAFNAALAVALSEGHSLSEAIRWGQVGGALSTTRPGAQAAMPTRAELLAALGA